MIKHLENSIEKEYLFGMLINVLDVAVEKNLQNANSLEFISYKSKFDTITEILTDHSGDIIPWDCVETFAFSQTVAYSNLQFEVFDYIDICREDIYSSSKEKLKEQYKKFDNFASENLMRPLNFIIEF